MAEDGAAVEVAAVEEVLKVEDAAAGGEEEAAAADGEVGDGADESAPADAAAEAAGESSEVVEEKVEVPSNSMGAIIGRGGSEIVNMERVSGAKIQTPRRDEGDPNAATKLVSVSGTASQITKAKEMIMAAVNEPRSDSRIPQERSAPPINLAGFSFADRDELWKHCHTLIEGFTEGEPLSGSDAFFAFALLSAHPGATEKYGNGLTAIKYGVNEEYPDTKCFIAVRADGSETGFSYRKCIVSSAPMQLFHCLRMLSHGPYFCYASVIVSHAYGGAPCCRMPSSRAGATNVDAIVTMGRRRSARRSTSRPTSSLSSTAWEMAQISAQ